MSPTFKAKISGKYLILPALSQDDPSKMLLPAKF